MNKINKLLSIPTLVLVVVQISLCYLIINFGTYGFYFPSEINSLYFISLISAIYVGYYIDRIIGDYKSNKRRIVFASIFVFLSSFASLGNAIFLQRITYPINLKDFIEFAIVLVWFTPISIMILSCLEDIYSYKSNKGFLNSNRKFVFGYVCFSIIMAAAIIYIIAFNPAITSYDTARQFTQALGLQKLSNWHTPFHTLFLRYTVSICDAMGIKGYSLTVIALLQCGFFAVVWSSGISFLCEKGLNKALGILFTVIIAFLPNNSIMLITIWKDIPYTTSLLWLTIIFSKLIIDKENYKDKKFLYVEITLCLTIIMLLRQNGIVIFILALIALLFMLKFNAKIIISIVLAIAIIIVFKGPVFNLLDVEDNLTENGKYVGLAADINSVYEAGGEVSDEAYEFLMDVKDTDRVTMPGYSPYYTDVDIPNDLEMDMAGFLKMYLDTAFKNPLKMIKSILFRSDFIYNVVFPEDCYLSTSLFYGTVETDNNFSKMWVENFNGRNENSLTTLFTNMLIKLREPIYSFFVRRVGVYNIISLAFIFILLYKRNYKGTLIFTVWASQILSLLLSTAWQDYRYVWCFEILCFYFIAYFICNKSDEKETIKID